MPGIKEGRRQPRSGLFRLGEWLKPAFEIEGRVVAQSSTETDWVSRFADEVIAEAERRAPGKPVVVASGLSPPARSTWATSARS